MSFGDLLAAELKQRRARNPRYSLRAFARDLNTDHTTLSKWIRGKRRLSAFRMRLVGNRLGLTPKTIARLYVERCDEAVLETIRRRPDCVGSRQLARRLGTKIDEVNIALHRLLIAGRMRMPNTKRWIAEESPNA